MKIGDLVECKHSGNLGIVLDAKVHCGTHYLVQFEIMKVWLRLCNLEVISESR